jgi:hypothetical protein
LLSETHPALLRTTGPVTSGQVTVIIYGHFAGKEDRMLTAMVIPEFYAPDLHQEQQGRRPRPREKGFKSVISNGPRRLSPARRLPAPACRLGKVFRLSV